MSNNEEHITTFKAIGHPVRNDILTVLKAGPMSAGDISKNFDLSNATISHHLSILREAGLVRERKDRNFVIYELNTSVFEEAIRWFKTFI
ncbi:winged helix-turn-helix transcriptional regulator [Vagococcus coleopterorum]|uniref:Winged helix-turn-helix transcriptional regulator n=1 Tax=Vagococcus coleopterorum TaxID=2714946 RepID=A0A6G8AMD0_9ENTE|nr:autorepressor SdpR family transcription factor [Vagococcus coleopterorum]QIL46218.1 winged helix-turn-helix transcriptional regulator [Vagococcus coleopterorum]